MLKQAFFTTNGVPVPAVTSEQMREVDRVAVDEFGLGILQMMENAGRNLAGNALEMLHDLDAPIAVLAGSGGNGGGGLCAARHLLNRGLQVAIVLDRPPAALSGAAADQWRILQAAGASALSADEGLRHLSHAALVLDALIGYGLRGAARGAAAQLIERCNELGSRVLSLDVPSGLDATTGDAPGPVMHPERTLTLALPKTGLAERSGELTLADIGIPPQVYERIGMSFVWPEPGRYWLRLRRG